jgi:hypothetical protein
MPNEWGQDFGNPALVQDVLFIGPRLEKTHKLIEELGVSDWTVKYEDVKERYKSGVARFQRGDWGGFGLMMYARSFFPDGAGDYEMSKGLYNKLLGLPNEDFDECIKGAVVRAEKLAGTY